MAKKKGKKSHKPGLRLECPTIQKLPSSFHVTVPVVDELTTLLHANHSKPAARNMIKNHSFYNLHYSTCPFIIHDLEAAALFFRQLRPDILCFLRNIRIIVDTTTIKQSPHKILDVLQLIADCAPRRSLADIDLSAYPRARYMVRQVVASNTKGKTYTSYPCFLLVGLVGHNISLLVKEDQNVPETCTWVGCGVINRALKVKRCDSPSSRVNFLHRLPPEVRDMIYGYLVPTGRIVFEENGTKKGQNYGAAFAYLDWRDYCSMTHVCHILSDEITTFVTRNNRVDLRILTLEYYWSDREVAKIHHMVEGFTQRVPDWLVQRLRSLEIWRNIYPNKTFVSEPLATLFNCIAAQVSPHSKEDLSVKFVCDWTELEDNDPTIWSTRGSTFLARAFVNKCPNIGFTFHFDSREDHFARQSNRLVAGERKKYAEAIVKALNLNMAGFSSMIDVSLSDPVIVGEPFVRIQEIPLSLFGSRGL